MLTEKAIYDYVTSNYVVDLEITFDKLLEVYDDEEDAFDCGIWEPFENYSASHILEMIESDVDSLKHFLNTNGVEYVVET